MMSTISKYLLGLLAVLGSGFSLHAGSPASPQATPVPLNLPVADNVQVSGSDSRAATFNSQWLPKFQKIINDNLSESVVFTNAQGFRLDSSKLFLRQQAKETIRVYFLAEGAGYQNALGFAFTPAGSPTPGTPKLIFPNASIGSGARTIDEPIRPGDFVEIGKGGNGWQLDFFLISDGFRQWRNYVASNSGSSGDSCGDDDEDCHGGSGRDSDDRSGKGSKGGSGKSSNGGGSPTPPPSLAWLWNDISKNGDGIQHVVAFVMPNSPYILVGFEDIVGGGDLDFNDALFVVDIGMENTVPLTDDPSSLPQ